MPRDQNVTVSLCPPAQIFLTFLLYLIIFGGAGGIQEAQILQRTPEIAHQKPGQGPQGGIQKTGLVAVGQIQGFLRHGFAVQNHSFQKGRIFSSDNVVVAIEQVQPSSLFKPGKHAVDILVDLSDVAQLPVLPQFLPVPQFNIGKSIPVIVLHGRIVQMLVFQKIVGGGAHSPVTVAYQHIPGTSVKGQYQRLGKGTIQTSCDAHDSFLQRLPHFLQHLGRRQPCFL